MIFSDVIDAGTVVLTDGGIETRLLFGGFPGVDLDPVLGVAPLVGVGPSGAALRSIYSGYVDAVRAVGLPVVIGTPTFRAGPRWVTGAGGDHAQVIELNRRAAEAHLALRDEHDGGVFVAGVLGPAGDAYTPSEGLSVSAAADYHTTQASALAEAGVDLLFAATFPAVDEAVGACQAMATTGVPFVISFVLDADGRVLDGSTLDEAVGHVDAQEAPLYHSLSCIHPTVALSALRRATPHTRDRVRECKANGSRLPTTELVKLDHPESDAPDAFAAELWRLHTDVGVQVLGGCCGTDDHHIAALARLAAATSP